MALVPSYAEVSPSGTGVKILCTGVLNDKLAKINREKGVELYDGATTNRYFALTGHMVSTRPQSLTGQREALFALQSMITEPMRETLVTDDGENAEKAIKLLAHIRGERADDYEEWLKVGMALSWCDRSEEMLDQWMNWSRLSDKFDEDICRSKWDSFRREDGNLVTVSYLERIAKEDGYDPDKYQTFSISARELLAVEIPRNYIIDDLIVADEPMVIGGASKSLKTSLALEAALSIATGSKFLERFDVLAQQPVMFLSGESGAKTLQDNLRLMIQTRGIEQDRLSGLHMGFRLPKLDDIKMVDDLVEELKRKEIRVLFVDPLYRSLRVGDGASNIYSMGAQLDLIAEKIARAGITIILLHHFRKQGKSFSEAPELEDLSQSGMAEFGRQFLLLKRREEYQREGEHCLWFSWGGSAGHQGLRILDVYTGTKERGLAWQTTLRTVGEYQQSKEEQKIVSKEGREEDLRERVLSVIGANPGIKSKDIAVEVGGRKANVVDTLNALEFEMRINCVVGERGAKSWYISQ